MIYANIIDFFFLYHNSFMFSATLAVALNVDLIFMRQLIKLRSKLIKCHNLDYRQYITLFIKKKN